MDEIRAQEIIRARLSENRYQHSMRVAMVAREMARSFGLDESKAGLAGIVHDYARDMPGYELLSLAKEYNLLEDEVEENSPDLLHATVGAFLLYRDHGVDDEEVLNAVRSHTLGRVGMTDLEKVLFLADLIEPGRDFPGIDSLRCLARRNLDRGMVRAIELTLHYCMDQGRLIHPRTVLVRNYLLSSLPSD
ncbi:MAG: bis(5'-nucleosyl)-tetraphosphatase (symmetrical) YqeK [Syntrophomonadales bacterium]|jgi:predicted HD superfamily hydrolase involved in NAD metabolism